MDLRIPTLLRTAEKLQSLEPFYDRDYNGHVGYATFINCTSQNSR